jgi:hypothetical protein
MTNVSDPGESPGNLPKPVNTSVPFGPSEELVNFKSMQGEQNA